MIVEVVAVGTELLLGEIINSNVATIGRRLADTGFDAHFQTTVGDNLDRLVAALRIAASRADAVILTGGIGPTQDDMTREALAALGGREMRRDPAHAESIRRRLLATRGSVSENVLRMADYPDGAHPLPNTTGVALGIAMEIDGTWFYAMPGVPREMEAMLEYEVLPRLRAVSGEPAILKSRILRTWGYGESQIAEMLDDLYVSTNPSVAFLIRDSEVRIRISAKAETEERADEMIAGVEREIEARLGAAIFGRDDDTIEVLLVRALRERGWKLGTVEVSTLGLVGARLAASAGGESVFAGTVALGNGRQAGDTAAVDLLKYAPAGAQIAIAVGDVDGSGGDSNAARSVTIVVRTPTRTRTGEVRLLGDDDRARRFAINGALHAARLELLGGGWGEPVPE